MSYSFNDCRLLDQTAWDLIYGDYPRSLHRGLINGLANGDTPYTQKEADENQIRVNVNDLSLTRLAHDARTQYTNGFLGQARYFSAQTDMGPKHKRSLISSIVAKEANRPYKESVQYFESMRSKFASLVLHGIAPAVYENPDVIMPRPIGVEDALVPSNTLLGFDNLPFIFFRRQFTAMELQKATLRTKRDPGWNLPLVQRCVEWADSAMTQLMGSNYPEIWSPEKWEERVKQDGGFYASDQVPTIDCFDIYGYKEGDSKNPDGWVRRIILDSWSSPAITGGAIVINRDNNMKDKDGKELAPPGQNDWLYSSGEKRVASAWNEIATFQFADLSAVAPFRYHSVRSLGWMLYASCHLKNRMWCKLNEAGFEALLQYFKVKSMDDVQRAMKLELANMGIIDESITPVPAAERWQVNAALVESIFQINSNVVETNARSATGTPQQGGKERESNFQRMADIQQANALISAGLSQSYQYQAFEYRENFRRLLKENSKDPRARAFRASCLRQGVPESVLVPEAWDIQAERMMGGGNQTLEMMTAQELLQMRPMMDPEPQRVVLRDAVLALTKNPAKAMELVPDAPVVTDSIHDTEVVFGTLMGGNMVTPKSGLNSQEVAATIIKLMAAKITKILQSGGVGTPQDVQGLQTAGQYAGAYLQMLGQDKTAAPTVKKLGDALGKLMNEIRAMSQRQQEAAKAAQQQNGNRQPDPVELEKLKIEKAKGQTKLTQMQQSHAARTAQKQISFEQQLKQKQEQHAADLAAKDLETVANIHRGGMKSFGENEE